VKRLLAVLAPAAFLMSGCSVGVEEPTLEVKAPLGAPPAPEDTHLHLEAGADACENADAEVVDVTVRETETEVVIDAGLRIGGGSFGCDIRTVGDDFSVELDRPLGRRLVIDNSRDDRAVIWSPQMRRDVLRRLRVNRFDAEAFVRSEFPAGENTNCVAYGRTPNFSCTLTVPSREKPVVIDVLVEAAGELKALPEVPRERLPRELRRR
jgi:hypothetical protein